MGYLNSDGLETQIQYIKSYVQDKIKKHASMPIGHEYFSMNPNIPQGSLPLIGGVYSRDTYADLWAWVQTQTGYLITDSAWVTLSNTQNGNVPFYSSGDGSTTFRVPSLKCWIKGTDGVETVGTYLDAGLPNIEGSLVNTTERSDTAAGGEWYSINFSQSGALKTTSYLSGSALAESSYSNGEFLKSITFDASDSNPIYGNSDTVVPESIVGMWLVKAYGTVVDTGTIDEKAYMDEQLALNVPTGCVQAFAGNTTPQGWLLCDGSAVSRTQYSRLFGVIGTTYGAGDGTDTFNLPDLVDKFIQGNAVAGTEHSAGLPEIAGSIIVSRFATNPEGTGAFNNENTSVTYIAYGQNGLATATLPFLASRSNSIYGNSNTVQPPSVTMRYIIKY